MSNSISQYFHYKFLVLIAACLTQFLRGALISGTVQVYPLYFSERYEENVVSATISPVQMAVSYILVFPAMLLCHKFGPRIVQMTGATLACLGLLGTAFTKEAWQGVITNFILGSGTAGLIAAPFSAISLYFPGSKQLSATTWLIGIVLVGTMLAPKLAIGLIMKKVGFSNSFIISSALVFLAVPAGAIYRPISLDENSEEITDNPASSPRFSLKIRARKQGVFHLDHSTTTSAEKESSDTKSSFADQPTSKANSTDQPMTVISSTDQTMTNLNQLDQATCKKLPAHCITLLNSKTEMTDVGDLKSFTPDKKPKEEMAQKELSDKMKPDESPHLPPIEALDSSTEEILTSNAGNKKHVMRILCTNIKALSVLLSTSLIYCGYTSFSGILGAFVTKQYHIHIDSYTNGMMLFGVGLLVMSLVYIPITHHVSFSSCTVQTVAIFGMLAAQVALLWEVNEAQFSGLMIIYGTFFGLSTSATYGCGMEVVPYEYAATMYSFVSTCNGIGALLSPYAAAYIQEKVHAKGGIMLAAVLSLAAGLTLLPLSFINLRKPKKYVSSFVGQQETVIHTGFRTEYRHY